MKILITLDTLITGALIKVSYMSGDMRFPTKWYVQPAKPQISLRICRAFAIHFNSILVLSYWQNIIWFGVSKLNRKLQSLVWVYTCQNTTLLEITCHGSCSHVFCLPLFQPEVHPGQCWAFRWDGFFFLSLIPMKILITLDTLITGALIKVSYMSGDMRFPTKWYVQPAKPQISLRICRAFAIHFNSILVLSYWQNIIWFGVSKLNRKLQSLVWVYTCQNTTLLEITCHGSCSHVFCLPLFQPEVHPGQCWAFRGSQGYIVIKTSTTIIPSGFTLEHIPKSLTPSGEIDSAPKDFSVLVRKNSWLS